MYFIAVKTEGTGMAPALFASLSPFFLPREELMPILLQEPTRHPEVTSMRMKGNIVKKVEQKQTVSRSLQA